MARQSRRVADAINLSGWRRRVRHPLSWLPDIPVEQRSAYGKVWQNFASATSLVDGRHDTPEWRARGAAFAICCVRVPADVLSDKITEVRDALAPFPFIRIHPDGFLHIPIQELGFLRDEPRARDEINRSRLEEFSNVARIPIGEYPSFTIQIGGVNSFLDAPFLDIEDNGWLNRIHRRLLDIALIPPSTRYPYLPHITIAHYTEAVPVGTLPEVLSEWRGVQFGSFDVTDIEICTLRTDETYPVLEELYRLPLATASPVTPFTSAPNAVPGDATSFVSPGPQTRQIEADSIDRE